MKENTESLSSITETVNGAKKINGKFSAVKERLVNNTTPEDLIAIGALGLVLMTEGAMYPENLPTFVDQIFESIRLRPILVRNYGIAAGLLTFGEIAKTGGRRFINEKRFEYWKIVGQSVVYDAKEVSKSIQKIPRVLQRR